MHNLSRIVNKSSAGTDPGSRRSCGSDTERLSGMLIPIPTGGNQDGARMGGGAEKPSIRGMGRLRQSFYVRKLGCVKAAKVVGL